MISSQVSHASRITRFAVGEESRDASGAIPGLPPHAAALALSRSEVQRFRMTYGILFERVEDRDFPQGHYYAHIPSLGLTTHGLGIEGAREAARDLLRQWIAEKRANRESVPAPGEWVFSTLELSEDALQSA